MSLGFYLRYRFRIGSSLFCTVKANAYDFGVYDKYTIEELTGSGDMYASENDYTCAHYDVDLEQWVSDSSTWADFKATTLNIFMQPTINQGTVDLSAATTISNQFMNGLVFDNIILGSPTSIGDFAFAGGYDKVNVSSLTQRTCNKMTSVVIPRSVTHLGKGAFAYCNLLESITFENDQYIIEEYTGNDVNIFFVLNGAGSTVDADGYFISTIVGTSDQKSFNWRGKCNRAFGTSKGIMKVYSALADKILTFEGDFNPSNPNDYAIRVDGAGYFKLVETNDANASPVRIYTGSKIMALKKT